MTNLDQMRHVLWVLPVSLIILFYASCGGSDSGFKRSEDGAAKVRLTVQPTTIDTGELMQVSTLVWDFRYPEIVLKVRCPAGLQYLDDSAFVRVGNRLQQFWPSTVEADSTYRYVVFDVAPGNFGGSNSGEVVFQLFGDAAVNSGFVEVDADPDLSEIPEFSVSDPKFSAKDRVNIRVRGDQSNSASSSGSHASAGSTSS
jgi:hypothetical protein